MKKYKFFLPVILSLGLLCPLGQGVSAVRADAASVTVTSSSATLFTPSSYEEYLGLSAPSSVAHTDDGFAVSDGNNIYLYDRETGTYQTYEHTYNNDRNLNTVSELGFSSDGTLYFSDASTFLFSLDTDTLEVTRAAITCSTFTIYKDYLYFATVAGGGVTIATTKLDALDSSSAVTLDSLSAHSTPAICIDNGHLFYIDGIYLNDYASGDIVKLPADYTILSAAAADGVFYLCDSQGQLTVYDYESATVVAQYADEYWYAEYYDGYLYAIDGDIVAQFDARENKFTDYQIGASSAVAGRLNGASDAVYADGKLVVADKGNGRVTVYDTSDKSSSVFTTRFAPDKIAADGDSVLIMSGSACAVYDYKGNELFSYSDLSSGEVFRGAANSHGTYYAVTSNNSLCKIELSDGAYTAEKVSKQLSAVAQAIAADLYGGIYIYCADNAVYSFTEETAMRADSAGTRCYTFSSSVSSFLTDYLGGVYGLSGDTLYYAGGTATFDTEDCVYLSQSAPVKAVFGFETNTVYILYSDYIVETNAVDIDALDNIDVNGADEAIFRAETATLQVVELDENAVYVMFDLDSLAGADKFPYTGYDRLDGAQRAVLLGETGHYYIVALFEQNQKDYAACLVLKTDCTEIDAADCLTETDAFTEGKAYTTNEVGLYKYPYLADGIALLSLEKGAAVTVYGKVSLNDGTDYDFYYVSATAGNVTYTGYIPAAYLVPVASTSEAKDTVSYGYLFTDLETLVMTSADGQVKEVSTDNRFTVYGDPYESDSVSISYTDEDGTVYYATVSSEMLTTTNTRQLRNLVIIVIVVVALIIVTDYFLLRKKEESLDEEL